MIYYSIIVVLFFLGTLNLFKEDKIASLGYIFVILPIIVFIGGLRYEVGTDWYNYSVIFESNSVFTIDNPIEPLFSGLILISKFIFNSYSLFIFLLFTIAFLIKLNVFLKYSSYFVISVMLYIPVLFLVYDLNGLRQGIAIGITLASLGAIAEKKIGKYLLLNIIAIGFHYSAIIFLPFYFLAHINLKKITLSICILGSIAIGFLSQSLIQNFVSSNLGGAESIFAEKVFSYAGSESYGMALVFNFSSIHRLVIFFIFYFFMKK